ncbi:unnamed protein product, partial [Tetraodon nigroviridis]
DMSRLSVSRSPVSPMSAQGIPAPAHSPRPTRPCTSTWGVTCTPAAWPRSPSSPSPGENSAPSSC